MYFTDHIEGEKMSFNVLKELSKQLKECQSPSLHLVNIKDMEYSALQIELGKELADFIKELSNNLAKDIEHFQDIIEYDGSANSSFVYKITSENPIFSDIKEKLKKLKRELSICNVESDPFHYKNAYILQCSINFEKEKKSVLLISMQNPITTLKHKFFYTDNTFKKITGNILNLRPKIDVIIIGESVYFLNLSGEKLFNLESAYKNNATKKVNEIQDADLINNFNVFKSVAEKGSNPKRFLAYNESNVSALKNKSKRKQIAKKFSIPLDSSGKFDIKSDKEAEKVIKLICNKGMLEPFNENPVEVDGIRTWK